MQSLLAQSALRLRLATTRLFTRLGFGEHAILLPLAVLIGVASSAAAVAFHELIQWIRDTLYASLVAPDVLYGSGLALLVVFPAAGGLAVGLISKYIIRGREGHGVVDVIETVLRSRGRIRPLVALEQILTSAITIGSGGSAGAEGPIVQIGAALSSGVGQFFQLGRAHMPVLIGCGTAAGISAIFGAPIGGVLFTLEVILLDFSIRSFTPIVLASVVAYVTTQEIFQYLHPLQSHASIFTVPELLRSHGPLSWSAVPSVVLLGLACGLVGVLLTRAMQRSEEIFRRLKLSRSIRPALGGALVGVIGIAYVTIFGWLLLDTAKPFDFGAYPMPAFFGDGYGVIQQMIGDQYIARMQYSTLIMLLAFLLLAKIVATCLTLGSGGSGGIIAPSLFLGATTGALLGLLVRRLGWNAGLPPGFFALIGMGAVLAAVVHAPLAAILILMEVTRQEALVLPAMLGCIVATGTARLISRDSIYTVGLRRRGVVVGTGADAALLRQLSVDQVSLDPVQTVQLTAPLQSLLDAVADAESDLVAVDREGLYAGMALAEDVRTALLQKEAMPYLTVEDLVRSDLPTVNTTDDLGAVFEAFGRHDVPRLAVCLAARPGRVVGLISRKELMRTYHTALVGR
jgi:CIC family chloride channel protein